MQTASQRKLEDICSFEPRNRRRSCQTTGKLRQRRRKRLGEAVHACRAMLPSNKPSNNFLERATDVQGALKAFLGMVWWDISRSRKGQIKWDTVRVVRHISRKQSVAKARQKRETPLGAQPVSATLRKNKSWKDHTQTPTLRSQEFPWAWDMALSPAQVKFL